jgi:hypothetical protein
MLATAQLGSLGDLTFKSPPNSRGPRPTVAGTVTIPFQYPSATVQISSADDRQRGARDAYAAIVTVRDHQSSPSAQRAALLPRLPSSPGTCATSDEFEQAIARLNAWLTWARASRFQPAFVMIARTITEQRSRIGAGLRHGSNPRVDQ